MTFGSKFGPFSECFWFLEVLGDCAKLPQLQTTLAVLPHLGRRRLRSTDEGHGPETGAQDRAKPRS